MIAAAIEIADQDGLPALSMRRLAQGLGVEAMSLYHYFRSKDELVSAMVDTALGEIEPAAESDHWKAALRRTALSAREVLRRHRWASGVMMSAGASPAQLRRMEATLAALERAGFSPEVADHAYHAIESHIVGFSLWLASMPFKKKGDLARTASSFLAQISPDAYPHVVAHAQWHIAPPTAPTKTEFEFGLDLILDGLERLADPRRRTSRT